MGALFALLCLPSSATVLDRIAVVVGKIVITESEVLQEVRLTEFLNQQPLDLGPQQRRDTAERLIDQQLIRNEMEIGNYPKPSASEAQAVLREFRQEHYPGDVEYQAALKKYGVSEDQLQEHLNWQLQAIRFTDLRFQPQTSAPADGSETARRSAGANRAATSNVAETPTPPSHTAPTATQSTTTQTGADLESGSVDQQMDAWLKDARSQVRIQFKKEAFE